MNSETYRTHNGREYTIFYEIEGHITHYAPQQGPSWTDPGSPEEYEFEVTDFTIIKVVDEDDDVVTDEDLIKKICAVPNRAGNTVEDQAWNELGEYLYDNRNE